MALPNSKPKPGLLHELKRRNVFRVALAYIVVCWVILQVADVLFPALTLPEWSVRLVAALLILGFPLAVFFAWAFEATPEGVQLDPADAAHPDEPNRGRGYLIVSMAVALAAAVFLFVGDQYFDSDGPATAEDDKSVAVLPFVNMSSDASQEYFSDGLAEELMAALSTVPNLRVIGRTSSFQFKGRQQDIRDIGKTLNVSHVLEGSVRKAGNQLRVTAKLIGTHDGVNVWTDTYQRELDDIFRIQDDISSSVVAALKVQFRDPADNGHADRDAEAYDLYLKGLRSTHLNSADSIGTSKGLFLEALSLDEDLAVAWVQLARVYSNEIVAGRVPPQEGLLKLKDAIAQALRADPQMAGAHTALGSARMSFDWDWDGASAAFEKALSIDPNHAQTLSLMSVLAAALGRSKEAEEFSSRALRVDPLSLHAMHNRGFVHYLNREFELAETALRKSIEFSGGQSAVGTTMLTLTLVALERLDEAKTVNDKNHIESFRWASSSIINWMSGNHEEADEILENLVSKYGDRFAVPIAGSFSVRGRHDEAMVWLNRAYEQHDAQLLYLGVHPLHDNLRTTPAFQELLTKLKL